MLADRFVERLQHVLAIHEEGQPSLLLPLRQGGEQVLLELGMCLSIRMDAKSRLYILLAFPSLHASASFLRVAVDLDLARVPIDASDLRQRQPALSPPHRF